MTGVLRVEGRPQTGTGKKPCDDKGRDWSETATSQGTQRNAEATRRQQREKRVLPWDFEKHQSPASSSVLDIHFLQLSDNKHLLF